MIRAATPKLKTYVALTAWGLFMGIATGHIELVALVAPLLAAVILAAVVPAAPDVTLDLRVGTDRCIEGDLVDVTLELRSDTSWGEVELALAVPDGFELTGSERSATVRLEARTPLEHVWRLRATRWGAKRLGIVGIRLLGRGRLTVFEEVISRHRIVKVYPAHDRINKTFPPLDTQLYSGDYVARAAADGIEFAAVRPFVPGDSVRRVNWRVTSRRNSLHVNLSQPERNADLVLFLDTFSEAQVGNATTLDLTVRGASVIARHHLAHNDRIGLVSFGGMARWLTASMGRTHTYRIADFLIDVNTTFSFAWKDIELLPRGTLPSKAMVIAFSPLVDDRAFKALADINARGFPVAVVNTLVEDRVPPSPGAEGLLAHRAWTLERAMKRERLKMAGIPVTDWNGDESIQIALAQLPRRRRRIATGIR
ncbi:MAG: DUF58 domain-containing protein [Actinomycetota bacterium]|nr:DUF58 domain-containing protein [Actinomycetota bacterium]